MKNLGFFKTTVLTAGLLIAVASCSKEDTPLVQNPGTPQDETVVLGQILDYGPLTGLAKSESVEELREMRASFSNVGEVTNSNTGEAVATGREINLTFIVDEDHKIPSGSYVFYSGEIAQSFTLTTGMATLANAADPWEQYDHSVTGGGVSVLFDGNEYTFFFDLLLNNGEYLRGYAMGKMNYMDVHP